MMQEKRKPIDYERLFRQPIYLIPEKRTTALAKTLVVLTRLPLSAVEEELLNKILQAVKIDPAQIDKIAIADYHANANKDRSYILFFVSPEVLPKELAIFGTYVAAPAYDQAQVIIANDLANLATDVSGKKQLWTLLKQIFLQ